ncbi:MAG: S8 family serine peptidase [Gemmatimonadaceae bacterium]|nr:S8 family serine peptidase [Gemmatimonadaceae bacterium]
MFAATLWPEYLAASYFPGRVLDEAGLALLGSQPARRERVTPKKGAQDSMTKTLFLAGTDEDLRRLELLVQRAAPPEDADDALWDDLRTIADLVTPGVEDVLKPLRTKPTFFGAEDDVRPVPRIADDAGRLVWECVLHRTADVAAALALFEQRVRAVGGITDVERRLEASGLVYLAARLTEESARAVAELNPLRSVRPLPQIRPVLPPAFRMLDQTAVQPLADATPITEHRVAVFDGGVDPTCAVTGPAVMFKDLSGEAVDARALEHGSVVTNAVLFGYVASGEPLRRPEVAVDHYRIWPPPAAQAADADLYWVLQQIGAIVRKAEYRIAVICVAPDQEVDELTPHPWTAVLDDLAHETGTVFVVAAGNRGDLDPATGLHRVQVPADMANALGVGAATTRRGEAKKWDRAPYSSYGPGRPGGIMQPLVLQFGGTPDAPFIGITTAGRRVSTMGTSFAAPLVAHALGGALAAVGSTRGTAAFLRALAVHAAERNRPHKAAHHSFGRTLERYDGMWNCPPNEVTLLYADTLQRHTPVALPLPVPDGLPDETMLKIRCTAAFQTRVDPADPVDYSLSGITWTFRPHMEMFTFRLGEGDALEEVEVDVRDQQQVDDLLAQGYLPSSVPNTGSLNEFRSEAERRRDGKWETVFQAWAQPSAVNLHAPRLEFRYLAREDGELLKGATVPPLPFAMLVTVTAPPEVPLYELVRQQFRVLTPIQLDARLQI